MPATPVERSPIGIGATALLTPLTGIGHYTLQLATHLRALLAEPPWLFYGTSWSRDIRPPPEPRDPGVVAAFKRTVPFGFEAARFLQQRRFTAGARAHGLALYHEPNFLAFRFDGPTVVTIHDLSWVRFPETHPAERVRVMNAAMRSVVARTSHIVTDSEFVRREVIEHYAADPERVTAISLGVGAQFRPLAEASCRDALATLGLEYGRYVLAVGTLEPRKNLKAAIAAHQRLPAHARLPLAIAGMKGWGRHEAPPEGVRLLGYVAAQALPALYSGARAFLYPSLYEGFGLPPLEAMACGAPVIVSDRSSLPEVVGNAALRIDPTDGEALARALREILGDEALRARLAFAGPDQARRFTWERCARETLAVYERALTYERAGNLSKNRER